MANQHIDDYASGYEIIADRGAYDGTQTLDEYWGDDTADNSNFISDSWDKIWDWFEGLTESVRDALRDAGTNIRQAYNNAKTKVTDTISKVLVNLGTPFDLAMETIMELPDLLDKYFMTDFNVFVETGLKLYRVNKQLVQAIAEEEKAT